MIITEILKKYLNKKWKKKKMLNMHPLGRTFKDMNEHGFKSKKRLEKEQRWANKFW